ncbi:hypothetical protein PF011_g30184 [Phytophthora fragariae]|uniref:ARS-binding protein 1 N-terminal domain-containing protein n=2 Tax=Phytophthora fragariae TaxID=53985 RepID=A0A6A3GT76_9STRA|nr:hypothetical protein PF011_g30184 [Phytophthora fragariae]
MGSWMRIHQKRQLIEKAAECPTMAQHELAAWAKRVFKLKRSPAQSMGCPGTISTNRHHPVTICTSRVP